MRKALLVIAIILIVLILLIGALYLIERENINAAITAVTVSEDDIRQQREESKQSLQADLEEATGIDLAALEQEALAEIQAEGGGTPAPAQPEQISTDVAEGTGTSEAASEKTPPENVPLTQDDAKPLPPKKGSAEVQALLKRFYALQASYRGQIEAIRSSTAAQYESLPEEEHTTANRISIARSGVASASALEGACDAEVEALVGELRTALTNCGLDPALADRVMDYYLSEKGLTKAEYMSKYKKYLS